MFAAFMAAAQPCAAEDPGALARAGTAAIEQRRFADALQAFTRAAAMKPADAGMCFGAGVAAFMLGQDAVAQTRFECALALNPNHLEAARWLGDLHYRAGRLAEAIAIYESARHRSPRGGELQRQLEDWRKEYELQSRFHELRSEHFTALFELAADEPFARQVAARLEAAYTRIGESLGVYPSLPITVVLYTREQFSDITRLADWSAAAYDGRIRVPLADGLRQPEELDRVLSHEYVHAVIATVGGRNVPAWVNEGLATVLEPAETADAASTPTPGRPALSDLHRSFVGISARGAAEVAYASAAQAVRRLIDRRGVATVVALLEDLGRGESFARAFHQRAAMRYEDFAALVAPD
jgi:tetratricopeptide (TPR) repeat protein